MQATKTSLQEAVITHVEDEGKMKEGKKQERHTEDGSWTTNS